MFWGMDFLPLLWGISHITQLGTEAEPLTMANLLEEVLEECQVTASMLHSSVLGFSFFRILGE